MMLGDKVSGDCGERVWMRFFIVYAVAVDEVQGAD